MPGEEAEAQHSLRHSSLSSPFCSINILQESHQTLSNTHVSLTGIQDLTESISHHLLQWHVLVAGETMVSRADEMLTFAELLLCQVCQALHGQALSCPLPPLSPSFHTDHTTCVPCPFPRP